MRLKLPLLPKELRWLACLGLAGFIFYTSIVMVPDTAVDTVYEEGHTLIPYAFGLDKWRHFVAYATLAYSLAYATAHWDRPQTQRLLFVVGVAGLYGMGMEIGQSMLSHRYFDINDMLANIVGALLVVPWYALRSRLEFVPLLDWRPFDLVAE